MIPRKSRRGIIVLLALFLLSFWAIKQEEQPTEGPIEGLDLRLNYALEEFELKIIDDNGEHSMTMWAPRLTNDASTGIGHINDPRLVIHQEGFQWHMVSESATVAENRELIYLAGLVNIHRDGGLAQDWLEMDGSNVTVEAADRTAYSIDPVEIRDLSGVLTATGFQVNMATNEFELKNNVKGRYDLQNQ